VNGWVSDLHFSATPWPASPAGVAAFSRPGCHNDTAIQCGRGCGCHDKCHIR